jgi:hypothetical protein
VRLVLTPSFAHHDDLKNAVEDLQLGFFLSGVFFWGGGLLAGLSRQEKW